MVPEGWKNNKLGTLVKKVGSGVTPKGGSSVYLDEGIPLIRSQNVLWGKLSLEDVAFISNEQHHKMKGSKLKPLDVLLNITGASIGRCTVFPPHIGEANVNQHVCIIRPDASQLDSLFLSSYLNSYFGQNQILKFQAGGNRQGLNFEQVRSFKTPTPPLPEQQKIADILSTWDKAIEKQEALIAAKQKRKRALMQQLLTGKKRFKEFEGEEWKRKKLQDISNKPTAQINPASYANEEFEYYSIPAFQEYGKPETTFGKDIKSNKLLINCGVVLFGKLNPRILKIWLVDGKDDRRKIASTEFMPVIPDASLTIEYLYYALHEPRFLGVVMSLVGGSTGSHQRINPKGFYSTHIWIPPIAEQQKIASVLSSADKEIESLQSQLTAYKEQKRGLMQQLLTGKKRVKLDEVAA